MDDYHHQSNNKMILTNNQKRKYTNVFIETLMNFFGSKDSNLDQYDNLEFIDVNETKNRSKRKRSKKHEKQLN